MDATVEDKISFVCLIKSQFSFSNITDFVLNFNCLCRQKAFNQF